MIGLLEHFICAACPGELWPDHPATVGNLIALALEQGYLVSATPFGRLIRHQPGLWKENLILSTSGRKAIGETPLPTGDGLPETPTPGHEETPAMENPAEHATVDAAAKVDPTDAPAAANAVATTPAPEESTEQRCDRLTKRLERIEKARRKLAKHQNAVEQAEQAKKTADAKLKATIGERDKAVHEMERTIDDDRAGQAPLPGMDDADEPETEPANVEAGDSSNWPISELGAKQLKKIVGAEVFEAAKEREEPIGLSPDQLGKLEAAEIGTIADLEQTMRDKRDWWVILAKAQDAKIVTRVVDSLAAFRRANPQEARKPTLVERLQAKNDANTKTPLAALAEQNGIEAI